MLSKHRDTLSTNLVHPYLVNLLVTTRGTRGGQPPMSTFLAVDLRVVRGGHGRGDASKCQLA